MEGIIWVANSSEWTPAKMSWMNLTSIHWRIECSLGWQKWRVNASFRLIFRKHKLLNVPNQGSFISGLSGSQNIFDIAKKSNPNFWQWPLSRGRFRNFGIVRGSPLVCTLHNFHPFLQLSATNYSLPDNFNYLDPYHFDTFSNVEVVSVNECSVETFFLCNYWWIFARVISRKKPMDPCEKV